MSDILVAALAAIGSSSGHIGFFAGWRCLPRTLTFMLKNFSFSFHSHLFNLPFLCRIIPIFIVIVVKVILFVRFSIVGWRGFEEEHAYPTYVAPDA
jgi:hypothetical protein